MRLLILLNTREEITIPIAAGTTSTLSHMEITNTLRPLLTAFILLHLP